MSALELAQHQVSRPAVPWLLASVVAAFVPLVPHLPPWLLVVAALCVGWRFLVHRGRLSYPSRQLQSLFAVACLAGVFLHYGTLAGHQAGTALLAAMFALKLLEMYRERDAYVVIFIGYFVASTVFLFNFSLAMGGYVGLVVLLFTAALTATNEGDGVPRWEPARRALVLLLQSIPLAIVLFLVMPRIGPLWSLGLKPGEATTGMSDSISPGDIGKLGRSSAMAFRVQFEGMLPSPNDLYWRGLTLSGFDGRTWSQGDDLLRYPALLWYAGQPRPAWLERADQAAAAVPPDAERYSYSVLLEPTQQRWLFALATPQPPQADVGLAYDQRLVARNPVKTLRSYRVTSLPAQRRDVAAPRWLLLQNLQLPAQGAAQARNWAQLRRAESADEAAYIARVLEHFRSGGYRYTLQPPALGNEPVDEFLFRTRRGFCEHFAGSFVFLMRAAGIPARVVVGYMGGEWNPVGEYYTVRQYDAHAWAEVWLSGQGWVQVDPTGVVAPERITGGLRAALTEEERVLTQDAFESSWLGASELAIAMRDAVDFMNHAWSTWVLDYDDRAQRGFLRDWLGGLSPWRIGLALLATGGIVVLLLSLWMFRDRLLRREDPVAATWRRFCAKWAARGQARLPHEGPFDYGERLCRAEPRRAAEIRRFVALYVQLAYGSQPVTGAALATLRRASAAAA